MQALAAEFSGCRRKIPLLFAEKSLKTVCFESSVFKRALKWTRSVCLRAFSPQYARRFLQRVIFAGYRRQSLLRIEKPRSWAIFSNLKQKEESRLYRWKETLTFEAILVE